MTRATSPTELRLAAAALVASPALLAAGWLALPTPSGSTLEQLADVEGALARWTTSWILLLAGALTAVPAAALLARIAPTPGTTMVRVGWALSVLGAMGFVGLAAVRGLHGSQLADDVGAPGLDPGLAASWDGLQSGVLRPFVYTPEIMGVGILLLGIALAKGAQTRRAGALVAVGALVVVGALIVSQTLVAGVGAAIALVGAVPLAARAVRPQP